MSDAPIQNSPIDAARICLAGEEVMVLLRVRQFVDDVEAHNDQIQDQLEREFEEAFEIASSILSAEFGHGSASSEDEEDDFVQLSGVFSLTTWDVAGKQLFLAAAHEDRETPFFLVVGVRD